MDYFAVAQIHEHVADAFGEFFIKISFAAAAKNKVADFQFFGIAAGYFFAVMSLLNRGARQIDIDPAVKILNKSRAIKFLGGMIGLCSVAVWLSDMAESVTS